MAEVAQRLRVTTYSLYAWKLKFGWPDVVRQPELDQSAEVRRLRAELRRVTEERDILKVGSSRNPGECGADLEEEVLLVTVPVSATLDDLDCVVDQVSGYAIVLQGSTVFCDEPYKSGFSQGGHR
ncbi:transposase IS3/ [Burkholderia pseudomallei 305]|nr:transposase IS3/ [Burkholderia pseudomallei 305]